MRAEILSCGTELLLGHITDTNATYLAQNLSVLGIDLYHVSQVGDNLERIVESLRQGWERSQLIIMTGGLGPTEDDLSREAISTLLGETMTPVPELEADLRARFARQGVTMPERNLKQATLIPSAQTLPNPEGSAPGWFVEKDGRIIVAMPGVPREMYVMWEQQVIPRLQKYIQGIIFTRILRVYGLGESSVEERLQSLLSSTNPTIATYVKNDGINVRITAKATTKDAAAQQVAEMEQRARALLGTYIFGVEDDTLASVTGKALQARGQTLSVMESLTGGLLASAITDFQSSSKHFIGGIVSYSTELKIQMGVPRETVERYGVISAETAVAMARAVREQLKTDFGIGITGVAGPDRQEDKPVGTVHVAVCGPEGVVTVLGPGWRGRRADNKRHAVLAALNLLRYYLEGTVKPE